MILGHKNIILIKWTKDFFFLWQSLSHFFYNSTVFSSQNWWCSFCCLCNFSLSWLFNLNCGKKLRSVRWIYTKEIAFFSASFRSLNFIWNGNFRAWFVNTNWDYGAAQTLTGHLTAVPNFSVFQLGVFSPRVILKYCSAAEYCLSDCWMLSTVTTHSKKIGYWCQCRFFLYQTIQDLRAAVG